LYFHYIGEFSTTYIYGHVIKKFYCLIIKEKEKSNLDLVYVKIALAKGYTQIQVFEPLFIIKSGNQDFCCTTYYLLQGAATILPEKWKHLRATMHMSLQKNTTHKVGI